MSDTLATYNRRQVAERLNVCYTTARRLIDTGVIPINKDINRVMRSDLEAYENSLNKTDPKNITKFDYARLKRQLDDANDQIKSNKLLLNQIMELIVTSDRSNRELKI